MNRAHAGRHHKQLRIGKHHDRDETIDPVCRFRREGVEFLFGQSGDALLIGRVVNTVTIRRYHHLIARGHVCAPPAAPPRARERDGPVSRGPLIHCW